MTATHAEPAQGAPRPSPDLDQAIRFLELLDPDAEQFSFQSFDDNEGLKRGHLVKLAHGSFDELASLLVTLNKSGAGVFTTINATDLRGRKEANVIRVRAAFVDLDGSPLQPVQACSLEPHVIVESSPGRWHAYWLTDDLPLDQFKPVQQAIVERFGGDRACCDLPRVMRLPGFVHRKSTPFVSRIIQVSERLPYTADEILAEFPPIRRTDNGAGNGHAEGDRDMAELVRRIMTGEEYHSALRDLAFRYARSGMKPGQIVLSLRGLMDAAPESARDGRWTQRRSQIPMLVDTAIKKFDSEGELQTEPDTDARFDLSHDSLALDMGRRWADQARHVALWGKWLFWNGSRWEIDEHLRHMTRCREYLRDRADSLVRDATAGKIQALDQEKAEAIAKNLRTAQMVANVSGLARSNPELVATVEQWDSIPWLLGTPGGVVDLRNGQLRSAKTEDYITKAAAVAPTPPGARAALWESFLKRITGGNLDLQHYLQRFAGYSLTGSIQEHAFAFGYGTGANGKSVFINTLAWLLGDYAQTIPTEMLMVSNTDRHPTELARLRGVRLAIGSETEDGKRWAEAKIKSLTGGDTIPARYMRQDFFEFAPQFKLFLIGNYKPALHGVDEAMRRRLHFVPFTITIPLSERDPRLSEKLKREAAAILRWMIDGCLEWRRQGLNPPEIVRAATDDYLAGEDAFERWRDECTKLSDGWESSEDLWGSWRAWAERAGEFVGKQRKFSDKLAEHGFKPDRQPGTGKRGFRGLRLTRADYTGDTRYGA